jgi:hypothetical protein
MAILVIGLFLNGCMGMGRPCDSRAKTYGNEAVDQAMGDRSPGVTVSRQGGHK